MWVLIVLVLWTIAWIIAEAIPVFNDLLGLISSLFASWFTYGLSGVFWLYMNRGQYFKNPRKSALTVLNSLIFIIGAAIVSFYLLSPLLSPLRPFSISLTMTNSAELASMHPASPSTRTPRVAVGASPALTTPSHRLDEGSKGFNKGCIALVSEFIDLECCSKYFQLDNAFSWISIPVESDIGLPYVSETFSAAERLRLWRRKMSQSPLYPSKPLGGGFYVIIIVFEISQRMCIRASVFLVAQFNPTLH